MFFTFRITNSQTNPVPNSNTAAAMKSTAVQFTSRVNCMAISGVSKRADAVTKMVISRRFLFFGMLSWLFIKKILNEYKSALQFKVNESFLHFQMKCKKCYKLTPGT